MNRFVLRNLLFRLLQVWNCLIFFTALAGAVILSTLPPDFSRILILFSPPVIWITLGMIPACFWIRSSQSLYETRRFDFQWKQYIDVVKATSIATGLVALAATLFAQELATTAFVSTYWLISTLLMLVSSIALKILLKTLRLRGHNLRFVIIVGYGRTGRRIAAKIRRKRSLGYRLLGFVDVVPHIDGGAENEDKLLGNLADFQLLLSTTIVDEVIVTLPLRSYYAEIEKIILHCREQGVKVRFPELFNPGQMNIRFEGSDEFPSLTFYNAPDRSILLGLKRTLDILIASTVFIILLPLLAIVAIAIKLSSPSPVIFHQQRVGLNKHVFVLYKFRTMVENAEQMQDKLEDLNEASGPAFKIRNDPRITKIGNLLRRTSIDEMPQLINVIKGDMSLVGPRPLPLRDAEGIKENWQRRRFSMRPGITCLWQVSGRSNLEFNEWMRLDLRYIDEWSLKSDLVILLKTIPAVLKGSGAC